MKRFFLTALMLFVASSILAADHHTKGGKGKPQGNKAGLEHTAREFFEAVKAANAEKVKSTYTADYTFTGPDGRMVGAEERLKLMTTGPNPSPDFTGINVRTYGSTGVVTGTVTTKNASGGTDQSRFTQAWTWQAGRWRLVASHLSRIAP